MSPFSLSLFFPLSTIQPVFFFFCLLVICFYFKIPEKFWVSFSRRDSGLSKYHLFVWSNFNFLLNSQWITFPTHSYIFLHSFCASLLHSLIVINLSLSLNNLHFLFCCIPSISRVIKLVFMVLFCSAIRRDSVSHSKQCPDFTSLSF